MTSVTLLLRLAGPLQAWGNERAALHTRHTSAHPTKSGVIGMLAAALGRPREEPLGVLAELSFGVRCDVPGTLLEDYQIASDFRGRMLPSSEFLGSGAQKPTNDRAMQPSRRHYLQDAAFLAAIHGPETVIAQIAAAVRAPVYLLALGRRSCPPTMPLLLDTLPGTVEEALAGHPWIATEQARKVWQRRHLGAAPPEVELSAYVDDPHGQLTYRDQPVSFHPERRQHAHRPVAHRLIRVPSGFEAKPDAPTSASATDQGHDPLALLGW
ncbi:type I-E CRISPR-associated protein Cas5/CasD [Streptomyces sp. NPDC059447]|uniref:type I-E CRISPR-associated protein Cas5/CasD n=1 Tax=Streptomyces sp. NPDC059447 TaxID=3346834 RepID=UPI0036C4A5E9